MAVDNTQMIIQLLTQLLTQGKAQPTVVAAKSKGQPRLKGDAFLQALIAACVKAGYKDPQPRVNILTYDLWAKAGRQIPKDCASVRVNGRTTGLWHYDQTVAADASASSAPVKARVKARKSVTSDASNAELATKIAELQQQLNGG